MDRCPFQLRVVLGNGHDYGLALYQQPPGASGQDSPSAQWRQVVHVHGAPLHSVMDQVLATLKRAGYRPTELSASRRASFALAEELGVRLGLLLLAVKPLRKSARIAEISRQLDRMTEEEAYYWFSKATVSEAGRRAQKALRILLSRE